MSETQEHLKAEAERALSAYLTSVLKDQPITKTVSGACVIARRHAYGVEAEITTVLVEDYHPNY